MTTKPIELGLILEGEDAEEFMKNEKNPKSPKNKSRCLEKLSDFTKLIHFKDKCKYWCRQKTPNWYELKRTPAP